MIAFYTVISRIHGSLHEAFMKQKDADLAEALARAERRAADADRRTEALERQLAEQTEAAERQLAEEQRLRAAVAEERQRTEALERQLAEEQQRAYATSGLWSHQRCLDSRLPSPRDENNKFTADFEAPPQGQFRLKLDSVSTWTACPDEDRTMEQSIRAHRDAADHTDVR